MTDKNANTEIRKEFCPNCEAETPCTHEAELYVCDICGEDFAKYIVSRNCNVSDVSTTQDVTTPEPPEDALNARIAELEAENAELKERVAMLDVTAVFKSLGEMGYIEQTNKLHTRIAELESLVEQLIWVGNDLLVSNTNPVTITLFNGLVCNAKERER